MMINKTLPPPHPLLEGLGPKAVGLYKGPSIQKALGFGLCGGKVPVSHRGLQHCSLPPGHPQKLCPLC